nr:MAG TPA: hypothetical protein [Caudoviricetes sp.]
MPIRDTHDESHRLIAQAFESIGRALIDLRYAERTTRVGQELLVIAGQLAQITAPQGGMRKAGLNASPASQAGLAQDELAVLIRSAFPIDLTQTKARRLDGTADWLIRLSLSPGQELFLELPKVCDPRLLSGQTGSPTLLARLSAPNIEPPRATSGDQGEAPQVG